MRSGFYQNLLERGFIKPEDEITDVGPFMMYFDAFRELSTSRPAGMGLGPIPFTAIVEYSRVYPVGDFEEFHLIIRAMDMELLDLEAKKTEAKNKAPKAPNNSRK